MICFDRPGAEATGEVPENVNEAMEWVVHHLGMSVASEHGEGTLSGCGKWEGECWVTVEASDGSVYECPILDLNMSLKECP